LLLITSSLLAGEVNVFSSRHYDSDVQLYEKFTSQTGIKVNVVSGKDKALEKRILEEGKDSKQICTSHQMQEDLELHRPRECFKDLALQF